MRITRCEFSLPFTGFNATEGEVGVDSEIGCDPGRGSGSDSRRRNKPPGDSITVN